MFFIIEGLDRCGKSTLTEMIHDSIKDNHRVLLMRSYKPPSYYRTNKTSVAWECNHYFCKMNAIRDLLLKNFIVIMDRFHISSTIYEMEFRVGNDNYKRSMNDLFRVFFEDNGILSTPPVALITLLDDVDQIIQRDDHKSVGGMSPETLHILRSKFAAAHKECNVKHKLILDHSDLGGIAKGLGYALNWATDVYENFMETHDTMTESCNVC